MRDSGSTPSGSAGSAPVDVDARSSASARRHRPARRDRRRARRRAPSRSPSRPRCGRSPAATGSGSRATAACDSVLASVSSRCTRFSASASGVARGVEIRRARRCARPRRRRRRLPPRSARPARLRPRRRAGRCRRLCSVGQFALDRRRFRRRCAAARSACSRAAFSKLIALRGEVGERGGQFGEDLLGGGERAVGLGDAGVDAAAAAGAFARFRADRLFLGGEPRQRGFGVGGERWLRARCRRRTARAAGRARRCGPWRALPRGRGLARDVEPVQRGAGARLGLAQSGSAAAASAWRLEASASAPRCGRRPRARTGPWRARPRPPRRSRRSSAGDRASPRPCAPAPRPCDSGSPAAPASSARRSGRRAGRSRPRARSRLVSAAFSRSSASWRRACRPEMPAASSSTRRRCSGLAWMISPMRP